MFSDERMAKWAAEHLTPQDFASLPAAKAFTVLAGLVAQGRPLDSTTVWTKLHTEGDQLLSDFREIIQQAIIDDPYYNLDADVEAWGQAAVADMHEWAYTWMTRFAIEAAYDRLQSGTMPIDAVVRHLDMELEDAELRRAAFERSYDKPKDQLLELRDFLDGKHHVGIGYGYRAIDRTCVPTQPGNLVQIGGSGGSGKSTVLRNLIRNWVHAGHRVALLSAEMTAKEQLLNFAAMDLGIATDRLWRGALDDVEKLAIMQQAHWYLDSRLKINDRPYLTPETVVKIMKRYAKEGYDFLCLDHLHRVDLGDESKIRVNAGAFARELKNVAMLEKKRVVALVQLTKMDDTEEPTNANIRESAQIVEEADSVFFVWRKLVAVSYTGDGYWAPIVRDGERRIFEHEELPKGARWGKDPERVYLKPGKQRIRPEDAFFSVRFVRDTGLLYDLDPGPSPSGG